MNTPDVAIQAARFRIKDMPMAVRPEETPLIFVDGFQGLPALNGIVRINACQLSQNLDSPELGPKRVFVARLAMSPGTMSQLIKWPEENVRPQAVPAGEMPDTGKGRQAPRHNVRDLASRDRYDVLESHINDQSLFNHRSLGLGTFGLSLGVKRAIKYLWLSLSCVFAALRFRGSSL